VGVVRCQSSLHTTLARRKRRKGGSEEARMKVLQAFLLAANGVARAVAQTGTKVGGENNVSGAPLTVITESLQTRQGR
jgi:hypothetical protein